MSDDLAPVIDALHKLALNDPRKLYELSEQVDEALDEAHALKASPIREGAEGGPRDTAVQKLAADQLRRLRLKEQWTYERIGRKYGVSRERIRSLFETLCPFDYEAQKRSS